MYSIVVKKTYELLRNIWIPSLKWRHLAQYNTDIIGRLYQTIEKKGPVFAECLLKSTILLWQWRLYMEFIQANMTTVVVNIVVSININWLAKCSSNMSKTIARVSSGVPNTTEKQMKARGSRPSAFIVSRCLEPLMKPEARVFEMISQTKQLKNYAVIHFFVLSPPPPRNANERTIILAAMQSCHIT